MDPIIDRNEAHLRAFGDFDLPRKLGAVENIGLQMPAISPDGTRILYLRTDAEALSHMTLFGSPDPADTSPEGTLSVWIRPLEGGGPGERLSPERWAHSAVWSDCGRAVAYVVNGVAQPPSAAPEAQPLSIEQSAQPWAAGPQARAAGLQAPGPQPAVSHIASAIIVRHLDEGWDDVLGMPGIINCLPRFDGDDRTVLFSAGLSPHGPMRIFRQTAGPPPSGTAGRHPVPASPQGVDCLLAAGSDIDGSLICARAEGDELIWCRTVADDLVDLVGGWGASWRPAALQAWSGIHEPLSPNRRNLLFYDSQQNRISVWHRDDRRLRRHASDNISACWLTDDAIALATPEHLFAVETVTGRSLSLFNGSWIPCRYIASQRQLILLGLDIGRRLAIYEIMFRPRGSSAEQRPAQGREPFVRR